MKNIINKICLFALVLGSSINLIASTAAFAEILQFEGKPYRVERLGSLWKVYSQTVEAKLSLLSGRGGTADCNHINTTLQNRRYLMERCLDNPGEAYCRSLVWSLRLLAEGRPEADRPMPADYQQIWGIQNLSERQDVEALRAAVAAKFNAPLDKIEVVINSGEADTLALSEITLNIAEDSLIAKVQPLVSFERANLLGLSRGRWVTRNVMLACDIAAGKVSYQAKRTLQAQHVEQIPESVLQEIWRGYEILSRDFSPTNAELNLLSQAALTGFEIAHAFPKVSVSIQDSRLLPEQIFSRLFETKEGVIHLRFFSSRTGMRAVAYPDQNYQAEIEQIWSVR